jgi:putative hydrolase of the HAD superfamily
MKRPLLLDFGGVVLLTPFELRHLAEPILGPLSWNGPFDSSNDLEWQRFQNGEITERMFWANRAAEHGHDTRSFMHLFYEPSGDHLARPQMVALIHEYRALGGSVGVLTNDLQAFHGRKWMDGITVLNEFDFIVDGSITGFLKPDPRAFRLALEAFSEILTLNELDPTSVLFVDDQLVNFGGAHEVGIEPLWFDPTDVDDSVRRIRLALAMPTLAE